MVTTTLRRSSRRMTAVDNDGSKRGLSTNNEKPKQKRKKRQSIPKNIETDQLPKDTITKNNRKEPKKHKKSSKDSLPRTRQLEIESEDNNIVVMGIDEAGRGPLAG